MTNPRRLASGVLLVLLTFPLRALPQSPQVRDTPAASSSRASVLSRGWAAVAAGRHAEAVRAADELLKRNPQDHAAASLKIESQAPEHQIAALDSYEAWLRGSRNEDIHLLRPIAAHTLWAISRSPDRALRMQALEGLAAAGEGAADTALGELMRTGGPRMDAARARRGDSAAAARLLRESPDDVPPQALAEALGAAGDAAAPRLVELLEHPDASVRTAAASSLGRIGSNTAIGPLRDLLADQMVRPWAAVALARLGDPEGAAIVQEMLGSPVADIRLLAAEAYAGKAHGPWVDALTPLLEDPNGLTRIRAAELLADAAPEKAREALTRALSDPNPVVRAEVARTLEETRLVDSEESVATLRLMLRDGEATIRLHAARSLLRLINSA
jgi:hypothetical protein